MSNKIIKIAFTYILLFNFITVLYGKEIRTIKTNEAIIAMSISPNGKYIASVTEEDDGGYYKGFVKLWDINGKLIRVIGESESRANHHYFVKFSPDNKIIAVSGVKRGVTTLWDVNGTQILEIDDSQGYGVDSLNFSQDGKSIISTNRDKSIKLWALDGKLIRTIGKSDNRVNSVKFSSDGKRIVTVDYGKNINIWDINGGLIRKFEMDNFHQLKGASISVDGKTIVTVSQKEIDFDTYSIISLWSINGEYIREITPPVKKKKILTVNFSSDGKTIISSDENGVIKFWDNNLDNFLKGALRTIKYGTPEEIEKVLSIISFFKERKAVPHLIKQLSHENYNYVPEIATTLIRIGDTKAIKQLMKFYHQDNFKTYLRNCSHEEKVIRSDLLTFIASSRSKKISNFIGKILISSRDDGEIIACLDAISRYELKSRYLYKFLKKAMKQVFWYHHYQPGTREKVAKVLATFKNKKAYQTLIKLLAEDEFEKVRGRAALSLGQVGNHRTLPLLMKALKDNSDYVRGCAVYALGRIAKNNKRAKIDFGAIEYRYQSEKSEWVKLMCAATLLKLGKDKEGAYLKFIEATAKKTQDEKASKIARKLIKKYKSKKS